MHKQPGILYSRYWYSDRNESVHRQNLDGMLVFDNQIFVELAPNVFR